jgi:hypothetical protein
MKKVMVGMMLLAGGLCAAPRVAVRLQFGEPAPVAVVRPVCPGPGYVWVNGYWRPPIVERVAPRYDHARVFDHHDGDARFRR